MLFTYLNLPTIPDHLLYKKEEDFSHLKNKFSIPDYLFYKQFDIDNKELKDYLDSIFPCRIYATYQIVKPGIKIHKDINRTSCINYIIRTDPTARLNIFTDSFRLELSENIQERKWHWIDVSKFHGVSEFTSPRIAISVVLLDKTIYEIL